MNDPNIYSKLNILNNNQRRTYMLYIDDLEKLPKKEKPTKEPLFKDKGWLWGVMILIICILGFFSHRMLSTKQEE